MTAAAPDGPTEPVYDDAYPTCLETYATLRVSSGHHDPAHLAARLPISGMTCRLSKRRGPPIAIWRLSTQDTVQSRDTRRHVDWLLDRIEPFAIALDALRSGGAKADIFCYFVNIGQGGPMLSPPQLQRLAALRLEIGWDVYSGAEDDRGAPTDEKGE